MNGYSEGALDNYFGSCDDLIYVAEDNGDVVAYLAIEVHYEEKNYIYLDDISVSESYRSKGIGTRLIQAAEQYAGDMDIPMVVLHVEKSNEAAFRLYRRLGYETESEEGSRYLMLKRI